MLPRQRPFIKKKFKKRQKMHNTFGMWISLSGSTIQAGYYEPSAGLSGCVNPVYPRTLHSSPVIYTHKRVDTAEQGECSVVTQNIHIH